MSQQKLKRLSKVQLLELLLAQSRRVEELELQVQDLTCRLEAGVTTAELASTCTKMNALLETAQAAANQYLEHTRQHCDRQIAEAEAQAARIREAQQSPITEKGGDANEGDPGS